MTLFRYSFSIIKICPHISLSLMIIAFDFSIHKILLIIINFPFIPLLLLNYMRRHYSRPLPHSLSLTPLPVQATMLRPQVTARCSYHPLPLCSRRGLQPARPDLTGRLKAAARAHCLLGRHGVAARCAASQILRSYHVAAVELDLRGGGRGVDAAEVEEDCVA